MITHNKDKIIAAAKEAEISYSKQLATTQEHIEYLVLRDETWKMIDIQNKQQLASRDTKIAELREQIKTLEDKSVILRATIKCHEHWQSDADQLRKDVKLLRDALITWGDKDTPLGVRIDTMIKALAATEPKGQGK